MSPTPHTFFCFIKEGCPEQFLYRMCSKYWCVSFFYRFRTAGAMHPLQCVLQAQRLSTPLTSMCWVLLRTFRAHSSVSSTSCSNPEGKSSEGVQKDFSSRLATGPTFQHFLRSASVPQEKPSPPEVEDPPPYVSGDELLGRQRRGWLYFFPFGFLVPSQRLWPDCFCCSLTTFLALGS